MSITPKKFRKAPDCPDWGGKRFGAGRKAGPYGYAVALPWRVPEQLVEEIQARAKASKRNPREIHTEALAKGLELKPKG